MTAAAHPCAAMLEQLLRTGPLTSHAAVVRLGKDIGAPISMGTMSNLRNGSIPDLETARNLARIFDRPVTDFLPELIDDVGAARVVPVTDPKFGRLPLSAMRLSPINERRSCDPDALDELIEDVAERGILQNLNVYPDPEIGGQWLVAAGGRRWRACVALDRDDRLPIELQRFGLPVRFCKDAAEALVVTVVENLHREDPHPLDRAAAYARLRDDLGWNSDQIAASVHKSRDHVTQYLRVHDRLSDDDKHRLLTGAITFTEARDMVAVPGARGRQRKDADDGFGQEEAVADLGMLDRLRRVLTVHNIHASQADPADPLSEILDGSDLDTVAADLFTEFQLHVPTGFLQNSTLAELACGLKRVAEQQRQPDEVEPVKLSGLIDLAARAASGDIHLRGGADHQGHQFTPAEISRAASVVSREAGGGARLPISAQLARMLEAAFHHLRGRAIHPTDRLADDLGLLLEWTDPTIAFARREFGIELDAADLDGIVTLSDLTRHIIHRLGAAAAAIPPHPAERRTAPPPHPPRPSAVGGYVGALGNTILARAELTLDGRITALVLRHEITGQETTFVPAQIDVEDITNRDDGRRSSSPTED